MKKNDIVTVKIEDVGIGGEGIGKIGGYALFIKDAVVGDFVRAKIIKAKKSYGYGRLLEVLDSSPYRTEPFCPVARQCGGCQLQTLAYDKQLEFKQKKIEDNLRRIGGFDDLPKIPIEGMEYPSQYRNKAQFPVGTAKDGTPVAGFYAGRTHSIIPYTDCALGMPGGNEILKRVLRFMKEEGISPYDEKTHTGLVRHILIRCGSYSGQWMVCLVLNGTKLPKAKKLADLLWEIPGMTSFTYSVNTRQTNVIMGDTVHTIRGRAYITDSIGKISYRISPLSFFQVNPAQTEKLYRLVLEFAGLTGTETVWDLYCGIGTISLFLAQRAKKVYGVEIIPQAVWDARENAAQNGIQNAEFILGKAETILPLYYRNYTREPSGLAGASAGSMCPAETDVKADAVPVCPIDTDVKEAAHEYDDPIQKTCRCTAHADVIVVDPPRKGCAPELLKTMLLMQPDKIVYVSCNPATLSRDLQILCAGGYALTRIHAVDMFPQTVHVEVACCLHRVNS